tara:strand:- start:327 stop:1031 length:705 start_codon:yes stop_codon:yes gene_type:complete
MNDYPDWMKAVEQTYVVKFPKQHLATFGTTNINYYVVTEPIYTAIDPEKKELEGVIRKGRVIAEKPALITPRYAMNLSGFSDDAYDYMKRAAQIYGPNSPGILYKYRKEEGNLDVVSGIPQEIAWNISNELDRKKDNLSVVMVGIDEFWDVALLKFIYEFTSSSISYNTREFDSSGLMNPIASSGGIPKAAVNQIEDMFRSVQKGGSVDTLKDELDKWGIFEHYEERFLDLFRG